MLAKENLEAVFHKNGTEIKYNDKYYQVYADKPREDRGQDVFLVFFSDITKMRLLEIEQKLSHPVVMIVMIDSYEELFSSNLESDKARVSVQIDKLMEDFFSETQGILMKSHSDRFWVILEERKVAEIVEKKVKLLDKAREITINDRMTVTLSIGIGRTGKTLQESGDLAKQALDMALGRGGDQAAVKTETGFEFYGGVSKAIEKQTKVKTRIIANSLLELIESSDNVYIMGHKFSDLDSIGAAVGLASAIRNLKHPAYVVIDKLASLGIQLIDKLKSEEDPRNPLFIAPVQAREGMTEKALLVIVDTHNPQMLEDTELYTKAQRVVIIDHHRKMVNHIDNALIFHHEAFASSASEMVTELLQYFGKEGRITALQAEALLAGIMLDTKNFAVKTGVRTFEAAAFLKKLGADTINVKSLFANSIDNYKQKVNLVSTAKIYKKCAIASTQIVSDEMRVIAPQAADELLGITNVDASFVLYKCANGEIYISARSLGALNVQVIMEYLGGGGHQTMAGVQLRNVTIEESEKQLCEAIDKYYEA